MRPARRFDRPSLPEHLEPARAFYDEIARMVAEAVLKEINQQPARPRPQFRLIVRRNP
jgi:hypothetical protein